MCDSTLLSGANAFTYVYLLSTACDVASLEHCSFYWFCSACRVLSFQLWSLLSEGCYCHVSS